MLLLLVGGKGERAKREVMVGDGPSEGVLEVDVGMRMLMS